MAGKRVILIDDPIVRGTTSVKIVQMMRDAGATEVHMRIASPPITHPDFYGIDTPSQDALLAANHSLEDMCKYIGADSLAFLSVDGLYRWDTPKDAMPTAHNLSTIASPAITRPGWPTTAATVYPTIIAEPTG